MLAILVTKINRFLSSGRHKHAWIQSLPLPALENLYLYVFFFPLHIVTTLTKACRLLQALKIMACVAIQVLFNCETL